MRARLRLACLAGALAFATLPGATLLSPSEAHARVSIAYSLDELVAASPWALVVTPTEKRSLWEHVAGSRRIVTYTKLQIDDAVYGDGMGGSLWVRTMGGAVGKIGQLVSGEAQLDVGKPAILFLAQAKAGTYVVSGAAQGHFPVVVDNKDDGEIRKLTYSPAVGKLIPRKSDKGEPRTTIQQVLVGSTVDDAISKIRASKAALDAVEKQK